MKANLMQIHIRRQSWIRIRQRTRQCSYSRRIGKNRLSHLPYRPYLHPYRRPYHPYLPYLPYLEEKNVIARGEVSFCLSLCVRKS